VGGNAAVVFSNHNGLAIFGPRLRAQVGTTKELLLVDSGHLLLWYCRRLDRLLKLPQVFRVGNSLRAPRKDAGNAVAGARDDVAAFLAYRHGPNRDGGVGDGLNTLPVPPYPHGAVLARADQLAGGKAVQRVDEALVAMELGDLLALQLPEPNHAVVARAGDVGAAGVVGREPAQCSDNVRRHDADAGLYHAPFRLAEIVATDHVVRAARDDRLVVVREHIPDGSVLVGTARAVALEDQLRFPLGHAPDASLAVPAARDDVLVVGGNVERADVVGMADEHAEGIVGGVRSRQPDVDDAVARAGYHQAVAVLRRGRQEGERVDELGPLRYNFVVKGRGGRRRSPPYSNRFVARRREDGIGLGESDASDLRTRG